MEKIIFACPFSGNNEFEVLMLIRSIRKFGGSLAKKPIWIMTTLKKENISETIKEKFTAMEAEIIEILEEDVNLKFPFVSFTLGAAIAEKMCVGKTEFLVWLDSNSLVINEPKEFLLKKGKNLGYRPVHHTLIGSIFNEPIDTFWQTIYEKCNVSEEKIFPMKTHVDGNILRPYINSGFLVVRPERGILQLWWNHYKKNYDEPEIKEFYTKSDLYSIFTHQAFLTGTILSELKREEIQELSFNYNYPIHLYLESPKEYQPKSINEMITVRYYLKDKLDNSEWRAKIPLEEPLKGWIIEQLVSFPRVQDAQQKKVKFGRVPLIYPIPIILVGALVDDKPNFETVGDVCILGINPPIICISSGNTHYTNEGILKHGTFSINFPTTSMLSVTDYCGSVSGREIDKAQYFDIFYGELGNVPMIKNCPANIECKVIKEFSIQHRQIFIADVIQTYVNEEFVTEKDGQKFIVDMQKLDPIIYALDNRYYKIGEQIGIGYQESKKLTK
ncbi:MAG: flavin reductase family protein [Candidatus Heimdallarchaeota archaeon]|nr:flavin reductase family protein [Candidatus Heimdallarchaeota archaeon]